MAKLSDIPIRDPFILPIAAEGLYYLYSAALEGNKPVGFNARTSRDLNDWSDPRPVFRAPGGFWADRDFWAPEVHYYRRQYYLFASFKAAGVCRGTQILRSDLPDGPFAPISAGPVTPRDWECLDGTLYTAQGDAPWIVFCHEWLQVKDGAMCAMPLTADLAAPAGEPQLLFTASQAPWVTRGPREGYWVTDGPCLLCTRAGTLLMVWSSFTELGYAVGVARSPSGTILGPWQHADKPLFSQDGGHGSVFRTFGGALMLALHQPNTAPLERGRLLPLREENDTLVLAEGDSR
ncbi:MAG: glycoside hydrolase family 43 protein [Chloroflexi bacterium]|nr:glycoside hydrolase family 43 protein [Chloroflexota bacterium]